VAELHAQSDDPETGPCSCVYHQQALDTKATFLLSTPVLNR